MISCNTIILLALVICMMTPSEACFDDCRFKLCKESTVPLTPPNDTAITSGVCLPGTIVGIAHSGEAMVETDAGIRNISTASFPGLIQPYSPSFFKLYPIINTSYSGVGHEVPQTNQADYLSDTCVILPINDYQVLKPGVNNTLNVISNVVLKNKPFMDCVSFTVA